MAQTTSRHDAEASKNFLKRVPLLIQTVKLMEVDDAALLTLLCVAS